MRKIIAALLIPAFALPGPVLADNCRHTTYVAPAYYAPTYHAPVYHDDYYDRVLVVARAVAVDRPLYAYTSVGDGARAFYDTKRAVKEGTLEALQEFQGSLPGPSPAPAPPDGPVVPPLGSPNKAAPIPPAKSDGRVYKDIRSVLANRCASCHNPQKDPKRVDLSIDPARIDHKVAAYAATKVTRRAMPPKGDLPDTEFDLIVAWAEEKQAEALAATK